jgi:hypothetical protein
MHLMKVSRGSRAGQPDRIFPSQERQERILRFQRSFLSRGWAFLGIIPVNRLMIEHELKQPQRRPQYPEICSTPPASEAGVPCL